LKDLRELLDLGGLTIEELEKAKKVSLILSKNKILIK
jgi:hypothetical protein|tara:strand:- start:23 stop:133 length:111 start_codon:yes stop_codon:yes gene_type:complete